MGLFVAKSQSGASGWADRVVRIVPPGKPAEAFDIQLQMLSQFFSDNSGAVIYGGEAAPSIFHMHGNRLYLTHMVGSGWPAYNVYVYAAEIDLSTFELIDEVMWNVPGMPINAKVCVTAERNISVVGVYDSPKHLALANGSMAGAAPNLYVHTSHQAEDTSEVQLRADGVVVALVRDTADNSHPLLIATPNFGAGTFTISASYIPNTTDGGIYGEPMPAPQSPESAWTFEGLAGGIAVVHRRVNVGQWGHETTLARFVRFDGSVVRELAKPPGADYIYVYGQSAVPQWKDTYVLRGSVEDNAVHAETPFAVISNARTQQHSVLVGAVELAAFFGEPQPPEDGVLLPVKSHDQALRVYALDFPA